MKKWKKCLSALICAAVLFPADAVCASGSDDKLERELVQVMPAKADCMFEDGDVVGFIGDSITQVDYTGISYQEFIYNYYITRHPDWKLEFRNLGTASYMASDAVRLYSESAVVTDRAIDGINKAVIMFGMNEALHDWSASSYIHSIDQLVKLLNKKGIDNDHIILVAPTPYDQTRSSNYREDGSKKHRDDDLLYEYAGELKILADELGTHYIDLHTPMLWVTDIVQQMIPDDTLTVTDNVHPNAMGNTLAGFFFLYQQGAGKEVASVKIGEDKSAEARNAEVTKLKRKGDRYVTFRYQPESLPMAVTYEFDQATQYFEVIDEISREDLQVKGLHPDITYRLYMNQILVGQYKGSELAEGINLTNLDLNPGQEAAKQMETLNQAWHTTSSEYRAVVRQAMKGQADQTAVDEAYEAWNGKALALIGQMYDIAEKSTEHARIVEVVSEDYHVWMGHEIWQWIAGSIAAVAAAGGYLLWRKRRKRL